MSGKNGVKPHPVIVSGWSSQSLSREIAAVIGSQVVQIAAKQFPDKEIQTTILSNIRGREVIVVASGAGDPNKQEKEARLLMRAANRSGAKSVTLVLPYMWYGRSDGSFDERNAPALTDTIETLRQHCTKVLVADPHNHQFTSEKFTDANSPVKNCITAHFAYPFAVQLKYLFNQNLLLPEHLMLSHADAGSTKRISRSFRDSMYTVLGLTDRNCDQDDWAQGLKDRDKVTGKSRIKGFSMPVKGKDVVIFEDMISTGGTVCELADVLKDMGARSVIVFASSGLFTPIPDQHLTSAVDRVNASKIDAVFITDTYDHRLTDPEIHQAIAQSPIIHTIQSSAYLGAIISALHAEVEGDELDDENSISALLRGKHSDQISPNQRIAVPVEIKGNSPLFMLK